MKTVQNVSAVFLALLVSVVASPAVAQGGGDYEGEFRLGYRWVDGDGAERKLKEDVNQEDGPVLFQLDIEAKPAGENPFADHIELDINDLGSSAYETLHLGVRKYGRYKLTLDRHRSEYFYEDIILPPELADVRASTGGDFHHFDFERVRTNADLELYLSPAAKLSFGFDHSTKQGVGTTTFDISRDEFETERAIDETLQSSTLGFSYAWDKVTLVLEERQREYSNVVEVFLPGFSEGASPGPALLDFYFFDQPYDYISREHAVRILARPSPRWDIRFAAEAHDLDLDLEVSEHYQGQSFRGSPLTAFDIGDGDIQRDLSFYDLDLVCSLSDRLEFIGSVRSYHLEQEAESDLGSSENIGRWDIETTGFEAGLVYYLNRSLTLGAGLSAEQREVSFSQIEDGDGVGLDDAETDSDGFYVNARYKPSKTFELTAKIDTSSIDDALTLATPTDRERFRVRARKLFDNGLSLSAVYQLTDFENDGSGWGAETEKMAVRLGGKVGSVDFSFGYTVLDIERQIDAFVNEQLLFDDLYLADTSAVDGRVRWRVHDKVTLGCAARLYENDGSFGLERDEVRTFAEFRLRSDYLLGFAYRSLDYDERDQNFDDYDADIVELTIGYRF